MLFKQPRHSQTESSKEEHKSLFAHFNINERSSAITLGNCSENNAQSASHSCQGLEEKVASPSHKSLKDNNCNRPSK